MRVSDRVTETRESFSIRVDAELNDLIEHAAKLLGSTRSDFILEAARRAAQDILLDRTIVTASPKGFRKFAARVNVPPRPNERLSKNMRIAT